MHLDLFQFVLITHYFKRKRNWGKITKETHLYENAKTILNKSGNFLKYVNLFEIDSVFFLNLNDFFD